MAPYILVLTTTGNEHASAVGAAVEDLGGQVVRLNVDALVRASMRISIDSTEAGVINIDGMDLDTSSVSGVLVHHASVVVPESVGSDEIDRELIGSGWRNALRWLEHTLSHALWSNRPTASYLSASPGVQLAVASECGFRTPDSLFTNNLGELRNFENRYGGLIVKSGPLLGASLPGKRLLAHRVDVAGLAEHSVLASPCLFQRYIDKSHELRVHVIGDEVMACRIESQATEQTKTDWRNYQLASTPHYAEDLGEHLARSCRAVVRRLGLHIGIIDLIVTPEGDVVFLECNSQGHWLWIEHLTGLPITRILAQQLVTGTT